MERKGNSVALLAVGILAGVGLTSLLRPEPAIAQPATPSGGMLWPICTGISTRDDGNYGVVHRCWSDGRVEYAEYSGYWEGVHHWSSWKLVKP